MWKSMLIIALTCAIILGTMPSPAQAARDQSPCRQVVSACLGAGFVQGGARNGNGLWRDCINPIMQGWVRRNLLPRLNAALVAACRDRNPTFGQPRQARDRYGVGAVTAGEPVKPTPRPNASADAPLTTSSLPADKPSEAPLPRLKGATQNTGRPPASSPAGAPTSSSPSPIEPKPDSTEAGPEKTAQTADLGPEAIAPDTKSFGVAIGIVDTQPKLRTLWHEISTKHAALVAGLQPRRALRSDNKWQLIAGPFDSVAEATKVCDLFKKENLNCAATAFSGSEL
jgi:hypothetical protein